ncbi:S8 family serine peptidase [candidate division WOR-3 bacterium]|nr:S8 family serine peptidase [candidate division WOR-3 bacterium]
MTVRNVLFFLFVLPSLLISSDFASGQMIVKFRNEIRGSLAFEKEGDLIVSGFKDLDEALSDFDVTDYEQIIENYDSKRKFDYGLDMIYLFYFPAEIDVCEFVRTISKIPIVEYSEPNYIRNVFSSMVFNPFLVPNDPDYSQQWFLPNIGADSAWNIETGNHSKRVCIIDVGMEYSHPDISGNWITGYDFYDDDPDPDPGFWGFLETHGTHCCGCAAAVTNNSVGVASVGYAIGLIGVRAGFLFSISDAAATQGVYYACTTGASVISMSFGGPDPITTLQTAINEAYNNYDIIVCAAAGNNGDTVPQYPANGENVVSVAATNSANQRASFSTYGGWVDVSAPGEDIYSTLPSLGGNYGLMSGTSMACPVTAGLLTLMRCRFPSETNSQIITRLYASADSMPAEPLILQGLMGAGKINAFRALQDALSVEETPCIKDFDIKIYHLNDGRTSLIIASSRGLECKIDLFDASGRLTTRLFEGQLLGEKRLDLSGLSSGSYIYRISSVEGFFTGKIEIIK